MDRRRERLENHVALEARHQGVEARLDGRPGRRHTLGHACHDPAQDVLDAERDLLEILVECRGSPHRSEYDDDEEAEAERQ